MKPRDRPAEATPDLRKYAWLAIVTAVLTVLLKGSAWAITGSVGLLSDAAESMVNLVAAIVALVSLTIAARPADDDHHFGHSKAEYFSAALEGIMIFVAAASIIYLGIDRLLNPRPLGSLGIGLAVSIMAAVLNGIVGRILIKVGTRHRSITLRADGKHLMADVYTSVGVVVGLGLAWLTGWNWLDPVIAILVGVNILVCRLPADVRIRLRPDGRDPVPRGQRPDPGHPGRARRTGPDRIPRRAHARVRGPPVHGDAHAGARRLDGAARA